LQNTVLKKIHTTAKRFDLQPIQSQFTLHLVDEMILE